MGLNYFKNVDNGHGVYSIDKLIWSGEFLGSSDACGDLLNALRNNLALNFTYHCDTCPGHYRHIFNFSCSSSSGTAESYWLGIEFNGYSGKIEPLWKLEANPNKILPSDEFSWLLSALRSSSLEWELKSFDLAVDFPVLRENSFMIKDKRNYALYMNSPEDKTEYLGRRHENGFVKLYNKQRESKLSFPLTRLEMTLQGNIEANGIHKAMPLVYVLHDLQMTFADSLLSDTERVVLAAVLREPGAVVGLGRKMRKKIECALEQHTLQLGLDNPSISVILTQVAAYRQLRIPE